MGNSQTEENPFENAQVAAEWISSIETEKGLIRDKEIYPRLRTWSQEVDGDIIDIGAGQGIAANVTILKEGAQYIGIEPSLPLLQRARELYAAPNRKFVKGDAYNLPIKSASVNGCFCINVWFHLEHLKTAAVEMARVLKPKGAYFIVTANPVAYPIWESMYFEEQHDGNKIVGKVRLPTGVLSKNNFYQHSYSTILDVLAYSQLHNTHTETFGKIKGKDEDLFICFIGHK